jgi:hypothetical protein
VSFLGISELDISVIDRVAAQLAMSTTFWDGGKELAARRKKQG